MPSIRAMHDFHISRLRLSTQVLVALVFVSLFLALVTAGTFQLVERSYLRNYIAEESKKKFDLLLLSSLDDIISEDVPRLQTTISHLVSRDRTVRRIRITNETGAELALWSHPATPKQGHLLPFSSDVVFSGERFGRLEVHWDTSAADEKAREHAYLLAFIGGGACLGLSVLIYLVIIGLVLDPIKRIATRLDRFRTGRFEVAERMPAGLAKEIHLLDISVNSLGEFIERKDAHASELSRAKETADAANLAKTEFLANMSHELRTPLNAITGFAEMIELGVYGPIENARYAEYVGHIRDSGLHLLALIDDILDVAKLESRKVELHFESVDLKEIIRLSVTLLDERIRRSGLRLDVQLDESMPPLSADGRRLRQVLINLITNAVKFTPAGGSVSVKATWHRFKGAIITIADTGIGIAADKLEAVMEPFTQVENAYTRRVQGSGLGLPIAKALVELHGGTLLLESRVNQGTTVSFSLPADLFLPSPSAADIGEDGGSAGSRGSDDAPVRSRGKFQSAPFGPMSAASGGRLH